MSRIFAFGMSFLFAYHLQGCQQGSEKNKTIFVSENGNKKFYGTIGADTVYAYTLKNNQTLKAVDNQLRSYTTGIMDTGQNG